MARTYGELKGRLQLLIDRDDAQEQITSVDNSTIDMLDVFIDAAEKRFYRSEAARIPPLEKVIEFSVSGGVGVEELDIPSDYFETRYLTAIGPDSDQTTLERTSPERILNINTSQRNGPLPTQFAYGNNKWIIKKPSEAVTVEANYYGYLNALDTLTNDTDHWLLNNADDIFIYWGAVEAALYYGSLSNMLEVWEARGEFIKNQIIEQEVRQQSSGSTPKQRRPYRTLY